MNSHRARKRFGQHFLISPYVLQQIMEALALQPTDHVLEIGPGQGALTECLLAELNHLDAIEIDRDLVFFLKQQFSTAKFNLIEADALNFPYQTLSQHPHDLRIVGNLPYNISTPLMFQLFKKINCIRDMHFMLQKEVVLRMTAPVSDKNYGRLSVMSQYFCDNDYLFTVLPDAFEPPPKVESAVVRLTPKKNAKFVAKDLDHFSEIVKEAFTYRRKKLGNSLKRLIDTKTLTSLDIDPNSRPQDISTAEYIRISNAISV